MRVLKVGVTSENKLKTNAVAKAYASFGRETKIIGYKTNSKVGEQPVGGQTLAGAKNRISDVIARKEELDRIVSIESGIFEKDGKWEDVGVALIFNPQTNEEAVEYSAAVTFPNQFVEKARQIGFDTTTVGQVMEEAGYVKDRKDPHLDLSGISRQVYLEDVVRALVEKVEKQWQMTKLQFTLPGNFTGCFVSDQNIEIGSKERLLLEAYVPGIRFVPEAQTIDATVRYIQSDNHKMVVAGENITLYDEWNETFSFDAYHLLSGVARKHYLSNNLFPIHAACVGQNDLVLIVGHSGSGKTLISLELLKKTGMKMYSGNKTVVDLAEEKISAIAGTKTMTVRTNDLKDSQIQGIQYGDRTAFRLDDSQYTQAKNISSIVLVRLNDGVRDWRKLSPTSGLHTLYPYFLDAVNADVVIGQDVFDGSVSQVTKNYLAERLGKALMHVPVYSATGPLAFIVDQITGMKK